MWMTMVIFCMETWHGGHIKIGLVKVGLVFPHLSCIYLLHSFTRVCEMYAIVAIVCCSATWLTLKRRKHCLNKETEKWKKDNEKKEKKLQDCSHTNQNPMMDKKIGRGKKRAKRQTVSDELQATLINHVLVYKISMRKAQRVQPNLSQLHVHSCTVTVSSIVLYAD